jgi:hypothetical protein
MINYSNKLLKTAIGWGGYSALKTVTFSNTSGTVNVFSVVGDVIVRLVAVCSTDLASGAGANISLGISGATAGIIASTVATSIDAREIWHDNSPDSELEDVSTMKSFIITDGNDIALTLSAQVDSGVLVFYCFWTPLSSDGQVISA